MERTLKLVFLITFFLIPIAIVDGSLKSYIDIKISILMLVTAILALDLLFRRKRIDFSPYFMLLTIFLLSKVLFFGDTHNLGLQLQSIALVVSSLTIGIWIYNSNLSVIYFCPAVLPGILVSIVCALSMTIYRVSLLSYYSPFGAPVGLKNSLSVYLAQTLPVLYLGLLTMEGWKGRLASICKLFFYLVIILSLWVVFASRTRSSWWMLIVFVCLLLWSIRKKFKPARLVLGSLCFCALVSMLLTAFFPNSLRWHSSAPYWKSISTMASLENSSGRQVLWRIALEMVRQNPFFGIGTGNYPILWQDYMQFTIYKDSKIRFLRPDLPLYNDYLQTMVENGIFSSMIFATLVFVYPMYLISRKQCKFSTILLLGVCVMTAFDALVDYPFNRPETVLIFITAISLALRELEAPIVLSGLIPKPLFSSILFFSLLMGVSLGGAVYFRWSFYNSNSKNVSDLRTAWIFWPWDCQWDGSILGRLQSVEDRQFAREIAEKRIQYWPNDAESQRMKAMIEK